MAVGEASIEAVEASSFHGSGHFHWHLPPRELPRSCMVSTGLHESPEKGLHFAPYTPTSFHVLTRTYTLPSTDLHVCTFMSFHEYGLTHTWPSPGPNPYRRPLLGWCALGRLYVAVLEYCSHSLCLAILKIAVLGKQLLGKTVRRRDWKRL